MLTRWIWISLRLTTLKDSSTVLDRAVALGTAVRNAVDIFFKGRLKRPAERGSDGTPKQKGTSVRAQDPVTAPHANAPPRTKVGTTEGRTSGHRHALAH